MLELTNVLFLFCIFFFSYMLIFIIRLFVETLQLALKVETKAWCQAYGKVCNAKYKAEMDEAFDFIEDMNKKLSHTINDLDDIRHVMGALKVIRENEIKIDMGIGPIEVRRVASVNHCEFINLEFINCQLLLFTIKILLNI